MAVARYWRIVGVRPWGGGELSLSELRLYSGASNVAATLGCTHAPASGSLADLSDDGLVSTCEFARAAYASAGFAFTFDCGAEVSVSAFGFGTGVDRSRALCAGTLQYLAAGAWVTYATFGAFPWPGAFAWSGNPSGGDEYLAYVTALLPLQTDFSAAIGSAWTVNGAASIDATPRFVGESSAQFSGGYLTSVYNADTDLSGGDWTVEFWVQFSSTGTYVLFNTGAGTGYWPLQIWLNGTSFGMRGFSPGGAMVFNILGGTATTGTAYFISARRAGSTFTLHVNGVLAGSENYAGVLFSPSVGPTVGAYNNGVAPTLGWIGQARITKGVAREPVVPTEPFPVDAGGGVAFVLLPISTLWAPASISASALTGVHRAPAALRATVARDVEFGGAGSVPGTVRRDADPVDLPLRRRVRLHRDVDGMMLRETWSDATTGAYLFTDINPAITYTVISYDHEHNYRAVAADNITPEVLP